jgi:pSer/pThr/pTyr-binding forkhead associated (FHA) protein
MIKLYVLDGPDKGKAFELQGDTIRVGRSPDNHVQLKDAYVSRGHLKILRRGNRLFIQDLESTNGSFLDGEPISPGIECEVREGIPIMIGISVICLGQGCLEEVKAFIDSMSGSRVSEEISQPDTGILELNR